MVSCVFFLVVRIIQLIQDSSPFFLANSWLQAMNRPSSKILPCLCLFPPILDGSRFPRRDVGDMGEISEGWLASTKLQTPADFAREHEEGDECKGNWGPARIYTSEP